MNYSDRWQRILALTGDPRRKGIIRETRLEQILEEGLAQLIREHGIDRVAEAAVKYSEERAETIQSEHCKEIDARIGETIDQDEANEAKQYLEPRAKAWQATAAALQQAVENMPH